MKRPLDHDLMHRMAVDLPAGCRALPPDRAAFEASTRRHVEADHRAEVERLRELLAERGADASFEDVVDVLDHPEATDAQLAAARPFAEAFPDLAVSIRRGRGPQKAPLKIRVALRLEPKVVDHFKAAGKGWQTRMGEVLKKAADV